MKLIVWLWNPWIEYTYTRHNIGFLFLDFLRGHYGLEDFKDSKYKWVISVWEIGWEKFILLKPTTYMNLSWESIIALMNFYKIDRKDFMVVYDDMSMDFGKLRFRDKWSAWWHNWIKSIIKVFGSEEFKRIKIWIWCNSRYDIADWVLSRLTNEELMSLSEHVFIEALQILEKEFIS